MFRLDLEEIEVQVIALAIHGTNTGHWHKQHSLTLAICAKYYHQLQNIISYSGGVKSQGTSAGFLSEGLQLARDNVILRKGLGP